MDAFEAPPLKNVIAFCKKKKIHLYYNKFIVQDLHSEVCGIYCLGLLFNNKLYRFKLQVYLFIYLV